MYSTEIREAGEFPPQTLFSHLAVCLLSDMLCVLSFLCQSPPPPSLLLPVGLAVAPAVECISPKMAAALLLAVRKRKKETKIKKRKIESDTTRQRRCNLDKKKEK